MPRYPSAVVGKTKDGRPIYGHPGTKHAHLCGKFYNIKDLVWGGGETTMPYIPDPNNSRFLTDEELEKHYTIQNGQLLSPWRGR